MSESVLRFRAQFSRAPRTTASHGRGRGARSPERRRAGRGRRSARLPRPWPEPRGRDRPLLDPQHLDVALGRLEPRSGTDGDPEPGRRTSSGSSSSRSCPTRRRPGRNTGDPTLRLAGSPPCMDGRPAAPRRTARSAGSAMRRRVSASATTPLRRAARRRGRARGRRRAGPGPLGEGDVPQVRRVEHAAEDCDRHERIEVSPSTSTSAPVFAPAALRASSSSSGRGPSPSPGSPGPAAQDPGRRVHRDEAGRRGTQPGRRRPRSVAPAPAGRARRARSPARRSPRR